MNRNFSSRDQSGGSIIARPQLWAHLRAEESTRSVTDRQVPGTGSGTVVASPSAAYGIAHDTEATGSLVLGANLSRGFAGSRVKFLRMHQRLPSLPGSPRALHRRHPSSLVLSSVRSTSAFPLTPRSLSSFNFLLVYSPPLPPSISHPKINRRSSLFVFGSRATSSAPPPRISRIAPSSSVSFPSSRWLLNHEATSVWRRGSVCAGVKEVFHEVSARAPRFTAVEMDSIFNWSLSAVRQTIDMWRR